MGSVIFVWGKMTSLLSQSLIEIQHFIELRRKSQYCEQYLWCDHIITIANILIYYYFIVITSVTKCVKEALTFHITTLPFKYFDT